MEYFYGLCRVDSAKYDEKKYITDSILCSMELV